VTAAQVAGRMAERLEGRLVVVTTRWTSMSRRPDWWSPGPADLLVTVADREDARLIVIAARGMGAVRAAFLGSVTIALAASATRPVVVLSEPAELALTERARRERRTTA
jgi:Universal stress protein family